MARRLRIRHKLALGMMLVAGIMLLLVVGTLQGLYSYRTTIRTIEGRLREREVAQQTQIQIQELLELTQNDPGPVPNIPLLSQQVHKIKQFLIIYEYLINDTLIHLRHPQSGYDERALVAQLRTRLDDYLNLIQRPPRNEMTVTPGSLTSWQQGKDMLDIRKQLELASQELQSIIDTDLNRRIGLGKTDFRNTLIMVISTCILGALFLLVLTRLAYRWIVYPVRDLKRKVVRVAQGQFEGHVDVQSGDEMQDLAEAFNHMSDRLNEMYRDLAKQVNDRSKQLIRSERLAGVGFLAAGVAHEINNPLASISFCSEALERRLSELLDRHPEHPDVPVIYNYLQMIQQEAFRCKDITQKLLEFSRIGDRPRQMTDVAEMVQSVINTVQHLHLHKNKQIHFQDHDRPHLMLNAPEMKSVILNLVVNALESMEEGGVLQIDLYMKDQQVILRFADTGCGMTQEVLDNIFEPFFTRSRTGKGVGLGLSISHRIVSQHGGEIEAESEGQGKGSVFTVTLPLVAPPIQSMDTPAPQPMRLAA